MVIIIMINYNFKWSCVVDCKCGKKIVIKVIIGWFGYVYVLNGKKFVCFDWIFL